MSNQRNERASHLPMKHTYIDITQLVHWPGKLTGIPRVMNELATRYATTEHASFVTWDHRTNSFYELDIGQSLSRRGEGIFYKTVASSSKTDDKPSNIRLDVIGLAKYATRSLKRHQPNLYYKIASRFNQTVLSIQGKMVNMRAKNELFILCGEWADELYHQAVLDAHSQGASIVHVVYDMLPIVTPQYSGHSTNSMDRYYRDILPLSRLVLSISESTKNDLISWLKQEKLAVPAIETIRLGDDFSYVQPKKPTHSMFRQSDAHFILCVGTIEARKNHTLLYYTYKLAKERSIMLPKLVVVGRKGWRSDDIYDVITSDPDTKDSFIVMTETSDEELSWLYSNCLFTVYPSFYEGWGLPVAESIMHGKVSLASDTSSIPEIAGDLIDYFNPYSSDECLALIQKLLIPANLKQAEKRIKRYKKTSWDDTFRQVKSHMENQYGK